MKLLHKKLVLRAVFALSVAIIFSSVYLHSETGEDSLVLARKLFHKINDLKWHHKNLIKYDEVIKRAEKIVKDYPTVDRSIEAQHLIYSCYKKQAKYQQRGKAFEKYVRLIEKLKGKDEALGIIREVAEEYFNQHEYADARDFFTILLTNYPEHKLASYAQYMITLCVKALHRDSKDKGPVIAQHRKLIDNYPNTEWGQRAYARLNALYMQLGNTKKVVELNYRYIKSCPQGEMAATWQYQIAVLLLVQHRRYEEALQEFEKVLKYYPESEVALMSRAYVKKIKQLSAQHKQVKPKVE